MPCRCQSGHRYEPGHADLSGNCVVQGVKRSNYQVLVDTFGMARLEWRRWDMFMVASLGSVAYNEKTFVGEMTTSQGETRIAELDYQRGLSGQFLVEVSLDTEESATQGWVLIETEPIKYNMENVTFLSEKIVSTEWLLLGEVRLEREEGEGSGDWTEVETSLEYRWEGEESWGNIGGVVRGLPCTVTRQDHSLTHTWAGLTTNMTHQERQEVRLALQAGTGINISLVGKLVSVDQAYTASLLSVFADGSLTVTEMRGVRTSHRLAEIKYKHDGPVWLQSGLPSPTTPRPPPSSTTVRTSQPPPPPPPPSRTPSRQEEREVGPPVTLFPPPPPPVSRPNPLKQFYPDPGDEEEDEDEDGVIFEHIVRVDILPLSPASRNTLNIGILVLLLCNLIL